MQLDDSIVAILHRVQTECSTDPSTQERIAARIADQASAPGETVSIGTPDQLRAVAAILNMTATSLEAVAKDRRERISKSEMRRR